MIYHRTVRLVLALTLLAGAALVTSCKPSGPILRTEINDGTYTAGQDIRYGTWTFANTERHTADTPCGWKVTKPSGSGDVVLRSHDTGNAVQTMYVGPGETLTVAHCGHGAWVTFKNTTNRGEV